MPSTAQPANVVNHLIFPLITAIIALSLYQQRGSAVREANVPDQQFSAARAAEHVAAIAVRPHPAGSDEHARVRDYLVTQLQSLHLTVEVQTSLVFTTWRDGARAVAVRNILARQEGTRSTGDVLLIAHYDTKAVSPGAMDDSAAVAALLETMRALKSSPPLANDVVCLLTDAEEYGEFGMKAFLNEHPKARQAVVALNFDARGNQGPVIMFETSGLNPALMRDFAATPRPVASSLAVEVYKRTRYGTDFNAIKRAGIPGFNFACIDGQESYHTLADTAGAFSRETLQHAGSYALSLARHFGENSPQRTPPANIIYFDLMGWKLIWYSPAVQLGLSIVVSAAYLVAIVVFCRRKITRPAQIGFWIYRLLAFAIVAFGALTMLHMFAIRFRDERLLLIGQKPLVAGLALLAMAAVLQLFLLSKKRNQSASFLLGALTCWVILLWVATIWFPGGAFLPAVPLALGLAALAITSQTRFATDWQKALVTVIGLAPAILLIFPILLNVLLGMGMAAMGLIVAVVILVSPLLFAPLMAFAEPKTKWVLPLITGAGACLVLFSWFNAAYTPEKPRLNSLFYLADADATNAVRAAMEPRLDADTVKWVGPDAVRKSLREYVAWESRRCWIAPTPMQPLPPPELIVLEDRAEGETRHLRLRLNSARNARTLMMFLQTPANDVQLNGKPLRDDKGPRNLGAGTVLTYVGPAAEGMELSFACRNGEVNLLLMDQSENLSELFPDHPNDPAAAPSWSLPFSDSVLVRKQFKL